MSGTRSVPDLLSLIRPSKRRNLLIAFLLAALAIAARLLPGARTIDDAFITFRYARNLLLGRGFVFNPGEHVLGTTTPLYTLMLSAWARRVAGRRRPFPGWRWRSTRCRRGHLPAAVAHGQGWSRSAQGWSAGFVWSVAPFSVTFAIGGLETSLVRSAADRCGVGFSFRPSHPHRPRLCPALLTRPDALILVGPLALHRLWRAFRAPREPIRLAHILGVPAAPGRLGCLRRILLRQPPTTFNCCQTCRLPPAALGFPHPLAAALCHPIQANTAGVEIFSSASGWSSTRSFLSLAPGAAFAANNRILACSLYPWLYFLAFSLTNPLLFRWYLTPPLPPLFLFILIGLETLLLAAFRTGKKNAPALLPAWKEAMIIALMLLPLVSSLKAWELRPDHGATRPAPEMAFIKLELLYGEVADSLRGEDPHPVKPWLQGMWACGASRQGRKILDTVGLNSPVSLEYYPLPADDYVINYAVPARLVLEQRPLSRSLPGGLHPQHTAQRPQLRGAIWPSAQLANRPLRQRRAAALSKDRQLTASPFP